MDSKRNSVPAWFLLPAAIFAFSPVYAQVPGVGPGVRVGNCWTDNNGVNHCDDEVARPPRPERPPRTDDGGTTNAPGRTGSDKDRAETITDGADKLYKNGDFIGAEREYRRAVGIYDSDPRAWFNLGGALQEQGRYAEALDAYKRAADLGNRRAKKHCKEFLAWYTARQQARQQDEIRLQNQLQTRQRIIDETARLENRSGGILSAAQLWRDYLKTAPNDTYALGELGRCAYIALILDPKLPRATVNEAVDALARAIRLEPANGYLYRRMMLLLARAGRADEAVAYAGEAVLKVGDREALKHDFYYMTEFALEHGSYGAAARILDIGARFLPEEWIRSRYSFVRMAQFHAAFKAGDMAGAAASARALIDLYPQNIDYRTLFGESLLRAGKVEEGKAEFDSVIRSQHNNMGKGIFIGKFVDVHVKHTKDWKTLLEGARSYAAQLSSADKFDRMSIANHHASLGEALLSLNRPAEARVELEIFFNHPYEGLEAIWIYNFAQRGESLHNQGHFEYAVRAYERALELKPDDADIKAKLAQSRAAAAERGLALRPLVPAIPSAPGVIGAVSPDVPAVDGGRFERGVATSGADLVRHARELRRNAGAPPREERTVIPIPFAVWEKRVREGKGLTPAELATFTTNDWNDLGRLVAKLGKDGDTPGTILAGRELGAGASARADQAGEWISQNREHVEAAADLLEYGAIAVLPMSRPVAVALEGAESGLTVLAKLLVLKSEHPDLKDVPGAVAWIIGPEAAKKIGETKLKAVYLRAGIPDIRAAQLGALTVKAAEDALTAQAGK